jgi:hypothetical protein
MSKPGSFQQFDSFTDADFKRSIWNALRMVAIGVVVGVPLIWWKLGWPSALLLVVGALISGTGLFEWLRLMTAVMVRMDSEGTSPVKPMGPVLVGFFLRLTLAAGLLYVSLKYLNGTVYALAAGLALGVVALLIEGLRLVRSWTV